MSKYVGKINRLSNEAIYRALYIGDFYSRYPRITKADVMKAISAFKHKLSYNNIIGKTYVGKSIVSEYSRKSDIQKYTDYENLIRFEFSGIILNGVQRVYNGFTMIP